MPGAYKLQVLTLEAWWACLCCVGLELKGCIALQKDQQLRHKVVYKPAYIVKFFGNLGLWDEFYAKSASSDSGIDGTILSALSIYLFNLSVIGLLISYHAVECTLFDIRLCRYAILHLFETSHSETAPGPS
jgi:hypothetical protein